MFSCFQSSEKKKKRRKVAPVTVSHDINELEDERQHEIVLHPLVFKLVKQYHQSIRQLRNFWKRYLEKLPENVYANLGHLTFYEFAAQQKKIGLPLEAFKDIRPVQTIKRIIKTLSQLLEMFDTKDMSSFSESLLWLRRLGKLHLGMGISAQSFMMFNQAFNDALRLIFEEKYKLEIQQQLLNFLKIIGHMMMRSKAWVGLLKNALQKESLNDLYLNNYDFQRLFNFWQNNVSNQPQEKKTQLSRSIIQQLELTQKTTKYNRTMKAFLQDACIIEKMSVIITEINDLWKGAAKTNLMGSSVDTSIASIASNTSEKLAVVEEDQAVKAHADDIGNDNDATLAKYMFEKGSQLLSMRVDSVALFDCLQLIIQVLQETYPIKFNGSLSKETELIFQTFIKLMVTSCPIVDTGVVKMSRFIRNHAFAVDLAVTYWENIFFLTKQQFGKINQHALSGFRIAEIGNLAHLKQNGALAVFESRGGIISRLNKCVLLIKQNQMQELFHLLKHTGSIHERLALSQKLQMSMLRSLDGALCEIQNDTNREYYAADTKYSWLVRRSIVTLLVLIVKISANDYTHDMVVNLEEFEKDPINLILFSLAEHLNVTMQFMQNHFSSQISASIQNFVFSGFMLNLNNHNHKNHKNHKNNSDNEEMFRALSIHLVKVVRISMQKIVDPITGDDIDGGNLTQFIRRQGLVAKRIGLTPHAAFVFKQLVLSGLEDEFKQMGHFTTKVAHSFAIVLSLIIEFLMQKTSAQVWQIIKKDPIMILDFQSSTQTK